MVLYYPNIYISLQNFKSTFFIIKHITKHSNDKKIYKGHTLQSKKNVLVTRYYIKSKIFNIIQKIYP